jgi:NodT family efflux transporter outer membrane factor (OMF) lipoprotein
MQTWGFTNGPAPKRTGVPMPVRWLCPLLLAIGFCGCTSPKEYIQNCFKVGPNYHEPPAPVASNWVESEDSRVHTDPVDLVRWWTVFNDPVLNDLEETAYRQNLNLRQAAFRVLEARAQRCIDIGGLFPQKQTANGLQSWNAESLKTANGGFITKRYLELWNLGFTLGWELDFWGKIRRQIESDTDLVDASVEDYDNVLVTLLGDVATNYMAMRTAELRIKYAKKNAVLQREIYNYAVGRQKVGVAFDLDVGQAGSVLKSTEATIPELEIGMQQSQYQICILLGIPPEDLLKKIGPGNIPKAPPEVALGIPADLLRRRPDVRQAERVAAAQSAQIGVAEADFYPAISLVGTLDYTAEKFKNVFNPKAFNGTFGPSFQWDILNYGRIWNNVRLQDARFQELVTAYQNSVLNAQQDVENGLVTFLKAQQREKLQQESVNFAEKAVTAIMGRYQQGLVEIIQVTQLQLIQLQAEDTLAQAQGEIPTGLIQVYRALGGGWQIRLGDGATAEPPAQPSAESLPPPKVEPPAETLPLPKVTP